MEEAHTNDMIVIMDWVANHTAWINLSRLLYKRQ